MALKCDGTYSSTSPLVGADAGQVCAAAGRADAGGLMLDPLTRQMIRQWLAHRLRAFPLWRWGRRRLRGIGTLYALRTAFLQVADQQLKLLDVAVEFLRRPAKTGPAQKAPVRLSASRYAASGRKAPRRGRRFPFAAMPRMPVKRQNLSGKRDSGERHGFV